ncbi:MAG: thymidine phosphorylase [Bacillota bacterium]|nr:thymidine phosphorylase [Bacillota bacterium]
MRMLDLIEHKKRGGEHATADIRALVEGYQAGDVPDYQMAAWLMAVRWRGMSLAETEALTWAMAESGERLDLSGLPRPWVDKHSTGGVGDKLTLIVVPLLVAAGATVIKLSGRGLGHTGGTVDKLGAIPGLRLFMETAELVECARRAGGCLAGHSSSLVPADGLIYALRDVTATVDSLPLIAASIMSKKLASGAETMVFDVKVGRGGLLRNLEEARALARTMLAIAERAGRRAVALLTAMDQPLGMAVGNALEVNEAVEVLRGGGPRDVRLLSVALAGAALWAAGAADSTAGGESEAAVLLDSGAGLRSFEGIIGAQGGDTAAALQPGGLHLRGPGHKVSAPAAGVIMDIDAHAVGMASVVLGAGRSRKGEDVDPGAGVQLHVRAGERVATGQPLATIYAAGQSRLQAGMERLACAFVLAGDNTGPSAAPGAVPAKGALSAGNALRARTGGLVLERIEAGASP